MRSFLRKKLAGLAGCTSGNAAVLVALGMPMLIGGAGLGVDTAQWYMWKRELQRAADSASIAGVYAKVQSASYSNAVTTDLARNNDINGITISTNATRSPSTGA